MIRRVGQTTCQVPVQRSDQILIVFGQDPWRHGLIQITFILSTESAVQSAMEMMQVEMETGFSGFSKDLSLKV